MQERGLQNMYTQISGLRTKCGNNEVSLDQDVVVVLNSSIENENEEFEVTSSDAVEAVVFDGDHEDGKGSLDSEWGAYKEEDGYNNDKNNG